MFRADFSISFWGECLMTSTYITNRIPTSVLGFISPFEKKFKAPPGYSIFQVPGYHAFMSIHTSDI